MTNAPSRALATLGLLNNAAAPDITIVAHVAPDAGPATLVNIASVDGPDTDPVPNNNTTQDPTEVADLANISLTKRQHRRQPGDRG